MAASSATLMAVGRSGRTYSIDVYVPDAVSTQLTFSASGLAGTGSPTTIKIAPEDVTIFDISTAAAPTAVGFVISADNAVINGAAIRWANQLAANPNRSKLRIGVKAGSYISALQY